MSLVRLQDCPPQRWKNGLGSTRQLAIHPSGAGTDDFVWRVSIAEVDRAAPFSAFPGVDRHIVLLEGAGFTMTLDGGRTHALHTPLQPFAFAGEAKIEIALRDGPTRDFNLMLRRTRARGRIAVCRTPGLLRTTPDLALVYCAEGSFNVAGHTLHAGDAWITAGEPDPLVLAPGAATLLVHVERLDDIGND